MPVTATFDIRESLLSRLELPGDVREEAKSTEGQPPTAPMAAVDLGAAAVGPDGHGYLMRSSAKPRVYVVSPFGELVRHFEVIPPEEKAQPTGLIFGTDGLLVFDFEVLAEEKGPARRQLFSFVDPSSGERLQNYEFSYSGHSPTRLIYPGDIYVFDC